MSCRCGCGQPARWGVGLTDLDVERDDEKVVVEFFTNQICLARVGLYCLEHECVNVVARDTLPQGMQDDEPEEVGLIGCCRLCAIEAARCMSPQRSAKLLRSALRLGCEDLFIETAARVCGLEYHGLDLEARILTGLLVRATLAHANPEEYLKVLGRVYNAGKRLKGGRGDT